jgi:hypothetical protein
VNTTLDPIATNEELRTAVLREIEWRSDSRSQDVKAGSLRVRNSHAGKG